jgi:cellobiose PTS system EIIA component
MNAEEIIMNIIIYSGEARAYAYDALRKANEGEFEGADASMEMANEEIGKAHDIQTSLLYKEASGDKVDITVLFVHAQDHLMTVISEKNLISEIIKLRKLVNPLLDK